MSESFGVALLKDLSQQLLEQLFLDIVFAPTKRILILVQTVDMSQATLIAPTYKEVLNHVSQIIKQEGITGLWKGNLLEVTRNFLYQVFNSLFINLYSRALSPSELEDENQNYFGRLLLVTAAEVSATIVQHPLKVIKIRLSGLPGPNTHLRHPSRNGFTDISNCARTIYQQEGLSGFYKGLGPSIMQSLSSLALYALERVFFSEKEPRPLTHDKLKKHRKRMLKALLKAGSPGNMLLTYLRRSNTVRSFTRTWERMVFRGIYHFAATFILYPYEVIQTRIIAKAAEPEEIRSKDVARELWDKQGILGLYRGASIGMVLVVGSLGAYPLMRGLSKSVANKVFGELSDVSKKIKEVNILDENKKI